MLVAGEGYYAVVTANRIGKRLERKDAADVAAFVHKSSTHGLIITLAIKMIMQRAIETPDNLK